ncbi:MAG: hypothetical protein ACK4X1_17155 [Terricaulis sp.]
MNFVPPPISQHRLKRVVAWAMLLLVWTMHFLFTATKVRHRHVDRRWRGLERLSQTVAAILIVRAVQLHPIHRRPRRHTDRFNARAGFKLRASQTCQIRAILGAGLRKKFYARDPFKRLGLLLNALRDLDAFAYRIGARARRGLTRLRAITPTRPPHDALPPHLMRAVAWADSS